MSSGLRDTEMAKAQCGTIRVKLFKIGAIIRVSVRRVVVSLSEAFPFQDDLRQGPCEPTKLGHATDDSCAYSRIEWMTRSGRRKPIANRGSVSAVRVHRPYWARFSAKNDQFLPPRDLRIGQPIPFGKDPPLERHNRC